MWGGRERLPHTVHPRQRRFPDSRKHPSIPMPFLASRRGTSRRMPAAVFALGVMLSLSACTATSAAVPSSSTDTAAASSAHALYVIGVDGETLAPGSTAGWDQDVFGSPASSDTTFSHPFAAPAGATSAATFLSPRGDERTPSAWNASGWLGITSDGVLLPNLKISGLTTAGSGDPSGTRAVARRGGDYSLGIAFLDANGAVIETDFTSVSITANDNPSSSSWTWSAPAG